ncbi:hypothetical protein N0V90_013211 [Kalmusia sp. IMI 367209]|nr:hypothetical protein N0V90_013211 [Kalmusia sp. IMI 367209]
MVSLKRLKAKFSGKQPPTSPLVEASPTTHARTALHPATSPPNLPERLWDRAYDQAKLNDSDVVDAYEKILSVRLSEQDAGASVTLHSEVLVSQQNEIAQDVDERRVQMQQLVRYGLSRTEKEVRVKKGMEDGIQAAMAVKEVIDKAIQASPEAAVAWVGVCFALEILMNPLTQASSNRQGIAYVVSRMDWYWNLSSLLLDENMTEAHSQALRDEMEKTVTQLYARLLLYQMKSVCYYHRSRLSVFARDLIKLDNWDGELSDIQATEVTVQTDSAQYNTLSIRARLGTIAETAKSQNAKLDSISSAIREQTRQQEMRYETSADNRCLEHLRLTDPRDDKTRIEETKGGLLKDSYCWVLENADFRQWRDNLHIQLLWINADPGKGKTMLVCGIIDELQRLIGPTGLLSYFFCQATDSRINSATSVLRGLIYLLITQQSSLILHVRKKFDHAGESLFEDANAWVALTEIFTSILQDPDLNDTYLIIDALDECVIDLPKLLNFVARNSASSRVKWIVSSRNRPDIKERLTKVGNGVRLSLEQNADSISAAVDVFIRERMHQLSQDKDYDDKTREAVQHHLSSNADGTFLWIALVCQSLEKVSKRHVTKKLNAFPAGLDSLYERMMEQISDSDDADVCKAILAIAAILYRPVTIEELVTLTEQLQDVANDAKAIREIIGHCGSFLTLRENTVYFVHQSAKDFLLDKGFNDIFPSGKEEVHHREASTWLTTKPAMMDEWGACLQTLEGHSSRVRSVAFSHDSNWIASASDDRTIKIWDASSGELLQTLEGHSDFVCSVAFSHDSTQIVSASADKTIKIWDSSGKLLRTLEGHSASVYSASFSHDSNHVVSASGDKTVKIWDSSGELLHTLEGHSAFVCSVAFSHDSTQIVSASADKTVKIWDASNGGCIQTLTGHSTWIDSVAFSHDSKRLASASRDKTVKIWDASSSRCIKTLTGHSGWIDSVTFSHDSTRLASASRDGTVKIWDSSGKHLQTLEGHSAFVCSVAFSHDSLQIVSGSYDKSAKIWDASSGKSPQTVEDHSGALIRSVAFSHDSTWVASGSGDGIIKIWDGSSGEHLQTLKGHSTSVLSVVFSYNSTRIASASNDKTIKIWDASSGELLQTLEGHSSWVTSAAFSHDSTQIVSASGDKTVKIWDTSSGKHLQTLKGHTYEVNSATFSHDSKRIASGSDDGMVKIWNTSSGEHLQTLEGHSAFIRSVAFSHDSTRIASASTDRRVKIWDASSGECLQTVEVGRLISNISFDSTGFYLHTNTGAVAIDDLSRPNRTTALMKPLPQHQYTGLSSDNAWVTYNSKKMLWLPLEYRPSSSVISGKKIAIGVTSRRIWIHTFDINEKFSEDAQ